MGQFEMIEIRSFKGTIGTSIPERAKLAKEGGFDPTLLEDESEARHISLKTFYAEETPVTCGQFAAFLESTGYDYPTDWSKQLSAKTSRMPVIGVSHEDAKAYAEWRGMRLPSPEEAEAVWQTLSSSAVVSPQPLAEVSPCSEVGQVSEWTSGERSHHSTTFALAKGFSWVHEAKWQRRIAASFWLPFRHRVTFVGFRCVSDNKSACPCCVPAEGAKPETSFEGESNEIGLFFADGQRYGRMVFEHKKTFVGLGMPESVYFNNENAIRYFNSPKLTTLRSDSENYLYSFPVESCNLTIGLEYSSRPKCERLALSYEVQNANSHSVSIRPSTCVNWTSGNHPLSNPEFFDIEGERTYLWLEGTGWKRLREYPRLGCCNRWIAEPMRAGDLPGFRGAALMALLSRDGEYIAGYGRHRLDPESRLSSNMCFTCMHIDPEIDVAPGGRERVEGRIYLMHGGLDDLLGEFTDNA